MEGRDPRGLNITVSISLRSDLHISPHLPHVVVTGDILLLLLLPGEGGGETAGEDDAQHLNHDEDAAHPSEDHEDDIDLVIQPSFYHEQATWKVSISVKLTWYQYSKSTFDVDLLDDDPDVGDLEEVLATARHLH